MNENQVRRDWPVPARYRDWSLLDFGDRGRNGPTNSDGALVVGPVGTGKTCFAGAIVRNAIENQGTSPTSIQWWRCRTLLASLANWSFEQRADLFSSVTGCTLLAIDDLGAAKETDAGLSWLLTILDERLDRELCTVVTSNLDGAAMEAFDERLFDRLRIFQRHKFEGASLRGRGVTPKLPLDEALRRAALSTVPHRPGSGTAEEVAAAKRRMANAIDYVKRNPRRPVGER